MQDQKPGETGRTPAASASHEVTSRSVLAIAVPITLSNATTPLVGFVDTLVIGQLGEAHLIGAVAVSANVFSLLLWAFGFLRMGTTGLTAQAVGSGSRVEISANLYRPMLIALALGLALILLQWPLGWAAFTLAGASPEVTAQARVYFDIRILAAPLTLMNYALLGWFIGRARADVAFALQLILNGINLVLSAIFVLVFDWGVAGVAAGVVLAEVIALVAGCLLAARWIGAHGSLPLWSDIVDPGELARVVRVNADIMVRTLCLLTIFFIVTATGARAGNEVLAANAILLAITAVTVYFLDGFAYAAETLVGQAIGARSRQRYAAATRISSAWAGLIAALLTLGLLLSGPSIIALMTPDETVRNTANSFYIWAALTPIVGVWCFQLDGIFIGATETRTMRNMMIVSLLAFLLSWMVLVPTLANHGLWAALMVSYIVRAITLWLALPALEQERFSGGVRR